MKTERLIASSRELRDKLSRITT